MAVTTRKDPRALLQDMWDLLAHEVDNLKHRREVGGGDDFDMEAQSKQLQRLITSIRGALKDSENLERQIKEDAENASEIELIEALIDDPQQRPLIIDALTARGWKVDTGKVKSEKTGSKRIMRAKKVAEEALSGFDLPTKEEEL